MDNVSLLKSLYDAFGRGEIPTVLGAMSPDIHWYEAEIVGDLRGKPMVRLHGGAARRAEELALTQWSVSLTHEREYAVAFVVAL